MARKVLPLREFALLLATMLLSVSIAGCIQAADSDHDGVLDVDDTDDDNDAVPDDFEVQAGSNPLNASDVSADADSDGLTLLQEFQNGTNPLSADTDADGMPDGFEVRWGFDGVDSLDGAADADDDGLTNAAEFSNGTAPRTADTDGDGIRDGWEVEHGFGPTNVSDAGLDPDGDFLTNLEESQWATDPFSKDSDEDRMEDGWEAHHGLNPRVGDDAGLDPDHDSVDLDLSGAIEDDERFTNLREYGNGTDPQSADSDNDGMSDGFEWGYHLDPTNGQDPGGDADHDGLTNLREAELHSSPRSVDSDGDTMRDGWEVLYAFDPTDASDAAEDRDGDGLTNAMEWEWFADPNDTDSDDDGSLDGADLNPNVDLVLHFALREFALALATAGIEASFDPAWEVLLRVSVGGAPALEIQFSLDGATNTTGSANDLPYNFEVDINDSVALVVINVECWELDLAETVGVNTDDLLDVDGTGANETLSFTFNISSLTIAGEIDSNQSDGASDMRSGEADARIRFVISFG